MRLIDPVSYNCVKVTRGMLYNKEPLPEWLSEGASIAVKMEGRSSFRTAMGLIVRIGGKTVTARMGEIIVRSDDGELIDCFSKSQFKKRFGVDLNGQT